MANAVTRLIVNDLRGVVDWQKVAEHGPTRISINL
jgi:hypothetical protein